MSNTTRSSKRRSASSAAASPALRLRWKCRRQGWTPACWKAAASGRTIETRDLYRGENVGLPYTFADGSRSRYLGGSSNCWGGWCRPLDPWDFEKRDWIPHSGWPFGLDELAPYYARTHELLKLGPQNFDPAYWEREIGRHDVRRYPLATGDMRDTVAQFSPPVRFGKVYRDDLSRSRNACACFCTRTS